MVRWIVDGPALRDETRVVVRSPLLLITLCATGCFAKQYYPAQYRPDVAQKIQGRRVILHPTELVFVPPVSASDLAEVDRRIRYHLEGYGYELQNIEPAAKILDSLPTASPKERLANYVQELGKQDLCDWLMVPSIVMRQAELRGSDARWDGVIRPIPAIGADEGTFSGFQKAASLDMTVYACGGEQVHESRGGIDVTFLISIGVSYESPGASPLELQERGVGGANARRDYLRNIDYLKEAIQLAFHPLIPMPGYPDDPTVYEH